MKDRKNKQSLSHAFKTQWQLCKLCFKTCPGYMAYFMYDGFRYQIIIFLEHCLGIREVLRCAEFHEPFMQAFVYIGIILLINAIQIIPDGYFIYRWSYKAKPKLYKALKEQMFEKASKLDLRCYDDPTYYNEFVLSVSEAEASIDRFLQLLNTIMQSLTIICSTGVFFLMTDPVGVVFVAVSFVLRLLVSKKLNKVKYDVRMDTNEHIRKRDYVSRVFYLKDYAKELRLHPNAGNQLDAEFREADDRIIEVNKKAGLKRAWLSFVSRYAVGDFLLDGLYTAWLVFRAAVLKTVSYSDAVVLFNRTNSLRKSMFMFADIGAIAHENGMFVDKLNAFLETEPVIEKDEGSDVPDEPGELCVEHVTFRYNEESEPVLHDINLKVKPGEHIAIVGYNGAGKTTLIKLLMRLYDPSEGIISYAGSNVATYNPSQYRRRIGVVFQDYQLYGATLAENVVMDRLSSDDIRSGEGVLTGALEMAGFASKLKALPDGLFTQVTTEFDKSGVDFSGGESQKIAISRTFYKNADILIMDEPSSALDPIAEYELNKAMETAARGKTVFYISHRLSTTRDADRIIMLEKGRIIEEGTHAELLERKQKYYEMWNAQAGRYKDE